MFTTMTSASRINGYLFVAFILGMFFYSAPMFVTYVYKNLSSIEKLTNGEVMRGFEQQYDQDIFLRNPSIELWSSIQYSLFKEGRVGVITGDDGWLFSKEEYPQVYAIDRQIDSIVQKVILAKNRLADKKLIIVPLPMKNDIYSEYNTLNNVIEIKDLYGKFIDKLRLNEIETISLRDSFINNKNNALLYFKTDTHWTPAGAKLAAQNIAQHTPELIGNENFITKVGSNTALEGDLLNYFGIIDSSMISHNGKEAYLEHITYKASSTIDSEDLFGDSSESIVLVGTSYTKMEPWNFPGFVKEALKQDIITVANEATGPLASMDEFINSELVHEPSIEYIIWEFPIRAILQE
jgi:alginate O-acetyltransferase complex protein AlgJ